MSVLVNKKSRVLVQGFTGSEGTFHSEQMISYGTNVVGGVTPGKGGQRHLDRPVFNTIQDAVNATEANVSVIFVPPAFAADSIMEAADADLPREHGRFVLLGRSPPALIQLPVVDLGTGSVRRPHPLRLARGVVRDHGVGGIEDPLRRTVVLLEDDRAGAGEVPLEVQDVAQVGASPRIDRLIVVTHDAQVPARPGEQACQLELSAVGVLVLVDHEVMPAPPERLTRLGVLAQEGDW